MGVEDADPPRAMAELAAAVPRKRRGAKLLGSDANAEYTTRVDAEPRPSSHAVDRAAAARRAWGVFV